MIKKHIEFSHLEIDEDIIKSEIKTLEEEVKTLSTDLSCDAMYFTNENITLSLRDDDVKTSLELNELFKNTRNTQNNELIIPKVID